ncbi:BSL1 [Symbiodinium pilosum]|uniref:BSL1 protein n=1 Tax=Symbiodinium pilosum TaxID=2952 RepID=A0A812IYM2_SYMPI|nr:BSL1 [Symbiodinium pilosum]
MWMNARMQQKEMFDQDLLQSIYEKSGQRVRNRTAVFGGGLMGILSMPFGPIGMAAGALFGALAPRQPCRYAHWALALQSFSASAELMSIPNVYAGLQSDLQMRPTELMQESMPPTMATDNTVPGGTHKANALKRLKRDPSFIFIRALTKNQESMRLVQPSSVERGIVFVAIVGDVVVLEFKPIADIAAASKNEANPQTLGFLGSPQKHDASAVGGCLRSVTVATCQCEIRYPDPYLYSGKAKATSLYNPPVELPSSSASNFFEEASAGEPEEMETRRKFNKFCTRAKDGAEPQHFLSFDNFVSLLAHYEAASPSAVSSYFYAVDRKRDNMIDFDEFFLGAVAGDPTTVHILNSFTGRPLEGERAQFTFDFYDTNHSGFLELEEFEKIDARPQLVRDCALAQLAPSTSRFHALEKADELGLIDRKDGSFIPPDKNKFYEFIMTERLRGTSRLFRFQKTLIRPHNRNTRRGHPPSANEVPAEANTTSVQPLPRSERGHRGERADGAERQPREGFELPILEAKLRFPEAKEDPIPDMTTEEPGSEQDSEMSPYKLGRESDAPSPSETKDVSALPPYDTYLPPAPPCQITLDTDLGVADAVIVAQRVVETLRVEDFPGLVPPPDGSFALLTSFELIGLCNAIRPILQEEEMIIPNVTEPVKVFGSLHGQLTDLLSWFKWHKPPSDEHMTGDLLYVNYVFLGDYADRGGYGLEVISILFSLKVLFPDRVCLLRGHHENRHVNYHLGLRQECEKRLGAQGLEVFEHLNNAFEYLSLAATTRGQYLAMGPGVVPASLSRLEHLKRFKKPLTLPHPSLAFGGEDETDEKILLELFIPASLLSREMGKSSVLTGKQLRAFCAVHKLWGILLSREIVPHGHLQEDCVIRVCSCLNYCDLPLGNLASILYITDEDSNVTVRPKVLTTYLDKQYCYLSDYTSPTVPRRNSSPSRWPKQVRAPTPDRIMAPEEAVGHSGPSATKRVQMRTMASSSFPRTRPVRRNGRALDQRYLMADGQLQATCGQVLQTLLVMYRCASRVLAEPEENFVLRVERLLDNELVRFVISQQQQLSSNNQGAVLAESMIFADARKGKRSKSKGTLPERELHAQIEEDSDHEDMDVLSNPGVRPGNWSSEMSRTSSGDSYEKKRTEEAQRVLKAPFFKSWEDFMEFDNNYKHKIPITQSDFSLLLEKESQGMQGWDMCVDRKEIKVAKTLQSDGSGCIFLRAWSSLPDVDLPVVFHMFYKCEKRMEWDRAFFEMKTLDQIEGSDILYSVLRVPACTPRDYVQYRRVKVLEDGTVLISLRSANHPDMPEKSGYIRAESFTSGYVMRRYNDGKEKGTKVFLMTCTDVKGIIPKWMINFVAPRKPGEWIDCLKKACLDYQAANPDYPALEEELEPFKQNHPFDYEDLFGLMMMPFCSCQKRLE